MFFCIISIFLIPIAKAQKEDTPATNHFVFRVFYQNGYVFPTDPFLKGRNAVSDGIDSYQAFSIGFSTQTTGEKLWEQLYNYPIWGGGIYMADFFNPDYAIESPKKILLRND